MFPFWAPGSDGWAVATGLGFRWAPFMFPFWAPGSDARSWAPIGLPSYFLSGRLVPLGSLHISFLGSWVGWVSRGQEAGLPLGFLHVSFFLGSWVGWVDRGQQAGLALGSLHIAERWAAATGLGFRWAPFMFPFFWVLGRMGGPPQRSWARIGLLSYFLSGLLGRMGGLRPSRWAPCMFPSFWAPGSDGWTAANKLGSHWAPFILPFWAPGSDGWAAATGLGFRWAPFMFLLSGSWVGWVGRGKEAGFPFWAHKIGWVVLGRMGGDIAVDVLCPRGSGYETLHDLTATWMMHERLLLAASARGECVFFVSPRTEAALVSMQSMPPMMPPTSGSMNIGGMPPQGFQSMPPQAGGPQGSMMPPMTNIPGSATIPRTSIPGTGMPGGVAMGAPPMSAASLQSGFQPGPMNSMPNMNSMPAMPGGCMQLLDVC
ncbi:hypothetical protein AK812_SmicGene37021 [Symbiodinium microadriaticum]|uniref:Uncharacterized protein n=1 Tax=Symbiodinium microadriaticum TaxID=2951 RepID=A0A1Q9CHJ8_SYMMI|nr:hypothetical protein AK812_SmicGene37021 [Symbiodinium microadriaticum]